MPALVVATDRGLYLPGRDEPVLPGRRIGALSVDGPTVWALADGVELLRVGSNGSAGPVATVEGGTATCVHVHRGTVLVGGDDAALWRLDGGALVPVESFGEAPTRSDWYTPWGGPPSVLSMASQRDDLYVGVHVGGILHSADGGRTWMATIDLGVDVHEVVVGDDGTVWVATGERALAESRDGGATWTYHAEGLHATYALAVAVTSAGVLVGASSGHAGRDGAVYLLEDVDEASERGADHPRRFEPVAGLPSPLGGAVGPRGIVGNGHHAALVAPDGTVYGSDDGGRHWARIEDFEGVTALALAPALAD